MGFGDKLAGLFTPSGDTIKGAMEGAGSLAVDIRTAIKGVELDPNKQLEVDKLLIELESKIAAAQSSIIVAEAQGGSWLQRNWRPLVMVWFVLLISLRFFGFAPEGITEAMYIKLMNLLTFGLSGYVVGRSAEKITTTLKQ